MVSKLKNIQYIILLIMVFTIPLSKKINGISLTLFYIISFFILFSNKSYLTKLKKAIPLLLVISIFFIMKIPYYFNSISSSIWIKETTRSLSFLLLPIFMITLSDQRKIVVKILNSLLAGTLVSIIILWGNLLLKLFLGKIKFIELLSNTTSNEYFTQLLSIHPSYLGIIINISAVYLIFSKNKSEILSKKRINIILLIFFLFSINLMARNSLIVLFILIIYHFAKNFNKKNLILISSIIILLGIITIIHPNNYLKRKLIYMTNIVDNDIGDRRLVRLKASYKTFKKAPLFGVGIGNDDVLRKEFYKTFREREAYIENHNSHNQLFEYLSTYGLFGGIIFITVFVILLIKSNKTGNIMFSYLFAILFIASLTESIFERVLGIILFSLVSSLFFLTLSQKKALKH